MIPQVGGFQGCYLDNHRNNWRCARAVCALCENAPKVPELTPRWGMTARPGLGVQSKVPNTAQTPLQRSRVRTRGLASRAASGNVQLRDYGDVASGNRRPLLRNEDNGPQPHGLRWDGHALRPPPPF